MLVAEKVIELLDGKYTYPKFEMEPKRLLNDLGKEICTEILHELACPQENWVQNAQHDKITLEGEQRKNFSTEEKLAILSEAQSSCTTKVAVCRKYDISKTTIDYWRKKLLNPNDNNYDDEKVNLRKENISFVPSLLKKIS
ncbi:transposase [Thermoanaerobacterium sp. DL9XJH110]|uniref:transposase n=1 Tax=Thermoanaerobacterium sp. DL9XJH110 TaxID=3386643 RepID=UPI003BB4942A